MPASAQTTEMITAAVVASLRELERARGKGTQLRGKQLSSSAKAQLIKEITGPRGSSAVNYLPREDKSSRTNVALPRSSSRSSPLNWQWGRLGDVAYRAVNETVQCQIAEDLASMVCSVDDPVVNGPLRVYGTRNALRAFVRHLRDDGIKALEQAVGKPAR